MDRWRIVFRPAKHSKRSYPTPGPSDPVMSNILAESLMPWAALEEEVELLPTPGAEEFYFTWYNNMKDKMEEDVNPDGLSLHRLANQLWKLSGILAISDGKAPNVGIVHIDMAEKILANEEKYFKQLMQVITQDPLVAQLEEVEKLIFKEGGVIEKRKLHDRLRRKRGFMPWGKVGIRFVSDLVDSGNITMEAFKVPGNKTSRQYYKLTEIGLSHLERAGVNKKQVDKARIVIRQHHHRLESEGKTR